MKYFLLMIISLQSFFINDTKKISYIKFEYIGINDKPIPIIVFSIDDLKLDEKNFQYSFKITPIAYNSICMYIKNDKKLFSKTQNYFYEITVFDGVGKNLYYVKNKSKLEKVFNELINRLARQDNRDEIKRRLNNVVSRL